MYARVMLLLALLVGSSALSAGYVEERAEAAKLSHQRKHKEALEAFQELAEKEGISDFQKTDALMRAAASARTLKKYDLAAKLAEKIPIESVSKSVQIQNLAGQNNYDEIVEKFGDAKIEKWPAYAALPAYRERGIAYSRQEKGKKAEHDLSRAAELMAHDTSEAAAYLYRSLALNREKNLGDKEKAAQAYNRVIEILRENPGGAGRLRSALAAVRFLREQGNYEPALDVLNIMTPYERGSGYWKGTILLSLGKTLEAAGKSEKAMKAYKEILADEKSQERHRKPAEQALEKLTGGKE